MIKACIFDMDGTVANTLASIASIGNEALAAHHLPPIPPEEYKLLVGNGADVLMRRMVKAVGASMEEKELHALRRTYDSIYESDPMRLVTAYSGIPELLSQLRERGVRLGILSNKPDNMTRFIGERLYPGLFHIIRGQLSGVAKKPDPAPALGLLRELSAREEIHPDEVLYIGDSGVDMETAVNAGMIPCGVLWGFREERELRDRGAVHLVRSSREILEIVLGGN